MCIAHSTAPITYINWHAHAVSTDFVNHFYRISTCFFSFFSVFVVVIDRRCSYCCRQSLFALLLCLNQVLLASIRLLLTTEEMISCSADQLLYDFFGLTAYSGAYSEMMTYLLAMPFRLIEAICSVSLAIEMYFYDEDDDVNRDEWCKYLVIKSNKMEIMAKESISGRCSWTRTIKSRFCWFPQVECRSISFFAFK